MTEPEWEHGIEWTFRDGRSFVAGGYSEAGARLMAHLSSNPKEHNPHATGVVRRPVAEWSPVVGASGVPLLPGEIKDAPTCEHGETEPHELFEDACLGPKGAPR